MVILYAVNAWDEFMVLLFVVQIKTVAVNGDIACCLQWSSSEYIAFIRAWILPTAVPVLISFLSHMLPFKYYTVTKEKKNRYVCQTPRCSAVSWQDWMPFPSQQT